MHARWLVCSIDYAQIEFRLMAHFSGDPGLVAMMCEPANDPFTTLAALWLKANPKEVSRRVSGCAVCTHMGGLVTLGRLAAR